MAKIKFNINSKKNPANINIRFYHGKEIDCNALTHILIDSKYWSNKMQRLKPNVDKKIKNHYLSKIEKLRNHIIFKFNDDYSTGKTINSTWLNNCVESFYKRDFQDTNSFLVSYIEKYIENSRKRINQNSGKSISNKTRSKYQNTLNKIKEFQEHTSKQYRIEEVNLKFHESFTNYLKIDKNYSDSYIQRTIRQLKSFLREAKSEGLKTSYEIENKRFSYKKGESIDTYLNEKEIEILFNLNLKENEKLDNTRDLFIIGLRTGLRISDLTRIEDFIFTKNVILISDSQKTGVHIEIPVHPQIKAILLKRNNKLPKIISSQKFNLYVKELCKEAGFTQKILGKLKNPKTNRKEKGYFEKYKLISSHTCRRSFATNLYGKIDDKTIMSITTHKSHKQFLSYIKTTQQEHIQKLAKYWEDTF